MRLIFINRFYWPDEPATAQLLGDLAEALAAAGHDVTVIASRPRRADVRAREIHRGVTILRAGGTRWSRTGAPGKAVDFLTFYFSALTNLAFTAGRGDTVVALTDPPLIGIGAWLVARLCSARVFHWVQDIYPEIASVLTGHRWTAIVRPLRNLAWRHSDGCVTLGSDMTATLVSAGVLASKLIVSPNWAPVGLSPQPRMRADLLRAAWHLEGQFIVAYSGNLGRVHDLEAVIEVAELLRDDAAIAFVFIGGGAQRSQLEAQVAKRGLPNVHFHSARPREQLAESLALGDVHLVTLLPGCEKLVFPSKLYGVTAVGRPVIFIGPVGCELARLVTEHGFGLAFSRDDMAEIGTSIRLLQSNSLVFGHLAEAASAFGRGHTGPTQALIFWGKLLGLGE